MRGNHGEDKKGQLEMEERSQSELATEDQLPTSNTTGKVIGQVRAT